MARMIPTVCIALALIPMATLAQVRAPLRMSHVAPRPAAAQQAVQRGDAVRANFRPDLVVKEMRREGDKSVHVLVANVGTAPAAGFSIEMTASTDRGEAHPVQSSTDSDGALAPDQQMWVNFFAFAESGMHGTEPVPLSDVHEVEVQLDGYHDTEPKSGGGWFGAPIDPMSALHPAEKNPCKPVIGCVAELDETNNSLRVRLADMRAW